MNSLALVRPVRSRAGFTILEMTLALSLAMGVAAALIGLLSQQVSFNRILADYRFLRDEAPQVSSLLTNLINKSDSYRIYPSLATAQAMEGAVRSGGRALRLRFRNPDGSLSHAVVAFETVSESGQLNYHYWDGTGSGWPSTPAWTISRQPNLVEFDNTSGVLLITMRGRQNEEVTYAGNPN